MTKSYTLSQKMLLIGLIGIFLSTVVALLVQYVIIRKQGIQLTTDTMRATLKQAESVRESISTLNQRHAFDEARLIEEFKRSKDFRETTIYKTVPVVAAWESIATIAAQENFEFRIPKNQARNPKNEPSAEESKILSQFEKQKIEEITYIDTKANKLVYARPIILTKDCLLCHGNPEQSPQKDGKDILGFRMENWNAGEVHGAFVLKADMERVDKVVYASIANTIAWMTPLACLIGWAFRYYCKTRLILPICHQLDEINQASQQSLLATNSITQASHSLAESSSKQAAALEETSASIEEMSSMTQHNAESAQKTKEMANTTCSTAEQSVHDMTRMSQAMNEIKSANDEVSKIIKSIDEIAFQTNLLALNAAVEAARAGEAGAGFAVVADEVRNLAQRSALAAKETSAKIENALNKTDGGVQICQLVQVNLEKIQDQIKKVDHLVEGIASASKEQEIGITQLNQAVTEMDQVVQGNAAQAQEMAASATELNAQMETVQNRLVDLLTLVGSEKEFNVISHSDMLPAQTKKLIS